MFTIAVQAFNKFDLVINCLNSIAESKNSEQFDLIIIQDGMEGNKVMRSHAESHSKTTQVIDSWVAKEGLPFKSISFEPKKEGFGTSKRAGQVIDHALSKNEYFLFTEDDLIFEKDSLTWFINALNSEEFEKETVWGIAGESFVFDFDEAKPSDSKLQKIIAFAHQNNLMDHFELSPRFPSSCFASSRNKWEEFGDIRRGPHGPRRLCEEAKAAEKKVIWPVIPRCIDIGMHHELGFSMTVRKDLSKIPQKYCYISSNDFSSTESSNYLSLADPRVIRKIKNHHLE